MTIETTNHNEKILSTLWIKHKWTPLTGIKIFQADFTHVRGVKTPGKYWIRHKNFDSDIGPFDSWLIAKSWLSACRRQALKIKGVYIAKHK